MKLAATILALLLPAYAFAQEEKAPPAQEPKDTPAQPADTPQTPPEPKRAPEAMEVLNKAIEAANKVDSVRFHAKGTPSGAMEQFFPHIDGDFAHVGWADEMPAQLSVDAMVKMPGEQAPGRVSGGRNAETFYLIDHNTKKAYEDVDPAVWGSRGFFMSQFGLSPLVSDKPYSEELEAQVVEMAESKEFNGQKCHAVRIVSEGGQGEGLWYFDQNYLPVHMVWSFTMGEQKGGFEADFTKLELNPKFEADHFTLKVPEGYEKVDDFAP